MKDLIKIVIVLSLNLILFTLAMMDVILGETFKVSLAVLLITYYSFEFIDR